VIRFGACMLCVCVTACAPARPTPFTDRLLAAANEWGDREYDGERAREQLAAIAADVARSRDRDKGAALNATLFDKWHFVREVDERSLRFALLPEVLQSRRGSCLGLGTLYLAIAEQLHWDVRGVIVPGHFFVRIAEDGVASNLELLRRGERMPDAWYRERFPIPGGAAREYGRPLTTDEVIGVLEYNAGEDRRERGQLLEAQRAYARASKHFPDFAEAHASRGSIAHLLGRLNEARSDYQMAKRVNPNLQGVDRNLALLERELAKSR
jgi:regulator of sirC expression with transglutaminase-like and TPR domain